MDAVNVCPKVCECCNVPNAHIWDTKILTRLMFVGNSPKRVIC